jgi:hypothetical protein
MSISTTNSYLFLCDGKGLGGLDLQMLERVLDARQRGAEAVLACSAKGKLAPYAASRGVKAERVEVNIPYYDPIATFRLGKIAKKHDVNVCVVGQSRLLSQALIARKVWGLEMAVVFYQQMQSGHPKRDWFHDKIYSSVDAAIVLTQQMKRELVETTVMQPDRRHRGCPKRPEQHKQTSQRTTTNTCVTSIWTVTTISNKWPACSSTPRAGLRRCFRGRAAIGKRWTTIAVRLNDGSASLQRTL